MLPLRPGKKPAILSVFAAALTISLPARAQDTPGDASEAALGMDPAAPQSAALPGGMAPRAGAPAGPDWRFDFHGMFTAPLRVGFNGRDDARPGQSKLVLHSPPQVPDDLETFSHTGVVPTPYAQLNFSYGTNVVTGTASIVATVPSVSAGFFDPSAQLGVNDLFLTITPDFGENTRFFINVGAFSNRYGSPGEYDEGRYGTPLIARTNGVGENVGVTHRIGDFTIAAEQGIQGQTGKPGNGAVPDASNGFAYAGTGASFVQHYHLGGGYGGLAFLGLHYLIAGSQDDRASQNSPDGRMDIVAADVRLTLKRFGHFYFAASHVDADNPASVGRVVEVLNTRGGWGFIRNYLADDVQNPENPEGSAVILGGQYDLSIGRLVSYPVPFTGDGPDIVGSVFGMYVRTKSDYVSAPNEPDYDGMQKYKFGVEGTYSLLPWLATSVRYDRVTPNDDEPRQTFAVLSPRVIFRTGWQARDQLVLQYSHWFNGDRVIVRDGYPAFEDRRMPPGPNRVDPDEDMISLSASMWW
ncbi:MAG TPA: hypothetical protein VFZ53_15670 [Polyangiaceae bacterium]